ncbi:formylglycine-generating enzyme family protein [Bradyrhizobium manausense]|uniref:formylglycine-generating enzyme family protein n=1 Tax=Bradyrhizobium TaxID=374 RepID=UPI001BA9749A|nr:MULTISPECIES: formylglycine-generating enzyme family protein [Bradyrhizobium]MBR0831051.1 formylglycine-generating enzyme family protein [Bradyrhizobium manausense]UVO30773.1 formylglycine-generating enzyme family protein [Bradyrhizobium arachidis]
MGGIPVRPFALLAFLMLTAPHASAQSMQEPTPIATPTASPTNVALANGSASALELRSARPLSRREEAALRPKDRFRECTHCPEMIVVPDGAFTMGAHADEIGSADDERPQHRVAVQRFGVGRHPVRTDEWKACVAARGCSHEAGLVAGHEGDPVAGILWEEASEYVQWLSRTTGRPYRLLSEAEREYVTRAGTMTAFWWGDMADLRQADAASADLIADVGIVAAMSLASTPQGANPFGLFGVHGGVYDWVEDCWHDNYVGAPADGSAWIDADCPGHVLRGGAATRALQTRRSAARIWFGSPNRMSYMSLRVARTLGR